MGHSLPTHQMVATAPLQISKLDKSYWNTENLKKKKRLLLPFIAEI